MRLNCEYGLETSNNLNLNIKSTNFKLSKSKVKHL